MILKILIGNALMAGCLWAFIARQDGNKQRIIEGIIFIGIAFVVGVVCGSQFDKQTYKQQTPNTQLDDIAARLDQL